MTRKPGQPLSSDKKARQPLSPAAQRWAEEFLADREQARRSMYLQAGFVPPLPPAVSPALPAPARSLPDEDALAAGILARIESGLATTQEERRYVHLKLHPVPGGGTYVPAPVRALSPTEKLVLDQRLLALDWTAGDEPK